MSVPGSTLRRAAPAGSVERLAARDAERAPGVEVLERRVDAHGHRLRGADRDVERRRSRSRSAPRGARPPAARPRRGPRRSPPPAAAARCRACPARTRRAGSRSGSASRCSGAGQAHGRRRRRRRAAAWPADRPRSRTCVGRRTPGTGASVSVGDRRLVRSHSSHDAPVRRPLADPRLRDPVEGARGAEARAPWKRDEELKRAAHARRARSSSESGDVVGHARPAVDRPRARGRRREHALEALLARRRGRARARAPAEPCSGSRRNGSSPVVRWNRYVRFLRVQVGAGQRALGQHRRPQRLGRAARPGICSSRMPAVIVGPGPARSTIRTRQPVDARQPDRQRGSSPRAPDSVRPLIYDRRDLRAGGRCTGSSCEVADVAAARRRRPRARGGRGSARGRPASASPRRRRARRTAGARGTAGSRARTARGTAAMPS